MKNFLKFTSDYRLNEKIILRDYLAMERTRLANERTLLSYIRTSLYFLLGGIALLQIQGFDNLKWIGYFSLVLCITLVIIGIWRFFSLQKQLHKYYRSQLFNPPPPEHGGDL